eukprot:symbB.v1.2.017335.t1/scaffold1345.1/size124088/5
MGIMPPYLLDFHKVKFDLKRKAGSRSESVLVAIGVHLALVLMLVFIAVFGFQAFKSFGNPEKFDRLVLFVVMGLGSVVALAKAISMKPKKEKNSSLDSTILTGPKHLLGSLSSCRFSSFARKVDELPIPEVVKQNLTGIGISKLFDIQTKAFDTILRGCLFVTALGAHAP